MTTKTLKRLFLLLLPFFAVFVKAEDKQWRLVMVTGQAMEMSRASNCSSTQVTLDRGVIGHYALPLNC